MATQLGRKPLREQIYIALSVGCVTMIVLLFLPVYPCVIAVTNPGKTILQTAPVDGSALAPIETREIIIDPRFEETEGRRSLFDTFLYRSEFKRITPQHPVLVWVVFFGIVLATTGVAWMVVRLIYKQLDEPFAKD